ncbi:MAG: FHA domain-containing protein [Candidatus Dadabacteria bacterium]|nr:MAG: FHA domain-containing protein [Candidatus Dadabacteria bacterium]
MTRLLQVEWVTPNGRSHARVLRLPATVGRGRDCSLVVDDPGVSDLHFRILPDSHDACRIVDAGSLAGIAVDDAPCVEATATPPATIRFAGHLLHLLPARRAQQSVPAGGSLDRDVLIGTVRQRVQQEPDLVTGADAEVVFRQWLEEAILAAGEQPEAHAALIAACLQDLVGLGVIEPLLEDPDVSEIMVNGPRQIWVERHGRIEPTDLQFADDGAVLRAIERIVLPLGRRIDQASPAVDGRLPDGSRVHAIIPPLAIDGPVLTIRRFRNDALDLEALIERGALDRPMAELLGAATACRCNIVISGGTGTGKTTMLNALSELIPTDERILTIEDAAELSLRQPHVVRLEARPANAEGQGAVPIRDLVRHALRMRPDRIIVGECRGAEALDMLQAMNTGHDGSLTTVHANSPRDALARIETMCLMADVGLPHEALRDQVARAIDLVVQLGRFRDGSRRIVEIAELTGREGNVIQLQTLYRWDGATGCWQASGYPPRFRGRM